jgi:hypothetical protein
MSKSAYALVLGAVVAALSLGMTAVAQAQERAPESDDAGQLFRQGERAAQMPPAPSDAVARVWRAEGLKARTTKDGVELFRQGERDMQEQATTPGRPAEPSGRPGWLVPALGALAAVLALSGGVAVMARRTRVNNRPRQAV